MPPIENVRFVHVRIYIPFALRSLVSIALRARPCLILIVLLVHPPYLKFVYSYLLLFFTHFRLQASGKAVVTGVVPSSPGYVPSIFIAHRIQQSHCSSIFHRVLLAHALALSASQFVRKRKSLRFYSNMHSGGLELARLTYIRVEDNLIRHRDDRYHSPGTRYTGARYQVLILMLTCGRCPRW